MPRRTGRSVCRDDHNWEGSNRSNPAIHANYNQLVTDCSLRPAARPGGWRRPCSWSGCPPRAGRQRAGWPRVRNAMAIPVITRGQVFCRPVRPAGVPGEQHDYQPGRHGPAPPRRAGPVAGRSHVQSGGDEDRRGDRPPVLASSGCWRQFARGLQGRFTPGGHAPPWAAIVPPRSSGPGDAGTVSRAGGSDRPLRPGGLSCCISAST
jgi:hypothetical protein